MKATFCFRHGCTLAALHSRLQKVRCIANGTGYPAVVPPVEMSKVRRGRRDFVHLHRPDRRVAEAALLVVVDGQCEQWVLEVVFERSGEG